MKLGNGISLSNAGKLLKKLNFEQFSDGKKIVYVKGKIVFIFPKIHGNKHLSIQHFKAFKFQLEMQGFI